MTFEERVDRLEFAVDKISDTLSDIYLTLEKYNKRITYLELRDKGYK